MNGEDKYIKEKQNRIKQFSRLRLGLMQMFYKPILNIFWIPMVAVLITLWYFKELVIDKIELPKLLFEPMGYSIIILEIILPILVILYLFDVIGEYTARRDECALVVAFSAKELRNGHPILLKKNKVKGTDVVRREFYSNISLNTWEERKDDIADAMNCHFVEPIQYVIGNGKHIVIYTQSGRIKQQRGIMYDE